ncbi:hypothetical protein [Pseudoruegeria sp. SK021]|uniref:hypothetical protein n=1 Tax=Pseudoruegeria sp. SK021 TaxID=1933035 RepID=UPI000A218FF7|nr:hypothetical protein [Pseudoruegeria sp. SK021]OSP53969.1 hypothetical protein BV911_14995 [Pseudoruegeria sp. SK021]
MATDQTPPDPSSEIQIPTRDDLLQMIQFGLAGGDTPGLTVLMAPDDAPLVLDGSVTAGSDALVDGVLTLVLNDGTVIVVTDLDGRDYEIEPVPSDPTRIQIRFVEPESPESHIERLGEQGSGSEHPIHDPDPLFGLSINPLLSPTEYPFLPTRDWEWSGTTGVESRLAVAQIRPAIARETDGVVTIQLSDFVELQVYEDGGETIKSVTLRIEQLPAGTTVTQGTLTAASDGTLTLTFTGSHAAYNALLITFPTDFSTTSRSDIDSGPLSGTVTAVSSFGDTASHTFNIRVLFEADIELDGPGTIALTETDDDIDFRPVDALNPRATDIDGSEDITTVTLTLPGLPTGALISYDGGTSFVSISGQFTFDGTLAEYGELVIRLPADFSTQNPPTSLVAHITARTNEGGFVSGDINISVGYELDVDLAAPALVSGAEDGNGGDGSGVTVDLGIVVEATDRDGSEDSTTVQIVFTDLPSGALFSGGSFDAASATWTGSMVEANALRLFLPGDYAGTITSVITALSPEGQTQTRQTIEIAAASDIDFSVTELVTAETDAVVMVIPSEAWQVSISDFDPSQPPERLDSVTLTLNGLPAGVTVSGVPVGTVTYDAAAGGTLVFTGSAAEYHALKLGFPKDYSTESPSADGLTIDGTLAATSTEDATGQSTAVTLRITPEGDLVIDSTLPDTVADETDAPTLVIPNDLLRPAATDADGSETMTELTLTVAGLPGGSDAGSLNLNLPDGATVTFAAQADGSTVMTIHLSTPQIADVATAYAAIRFELPTDFSTTNRTDLTTGTSQPLKLTVTASTDEDQDLSTDTPVDGQQTASRVVVIDSEADVTLSAPATLSGTEDSLAGDGSGAVVVLGIDVAPNDIDGSEDSTTVEIIYTDLPGGTVFSAGSYDMATGSWTGSWQDANGLTLTLPGDYSGTILSTIRAISPEGTVETQQTITIDPAGDIDLAITELTAQETDASVIVTPSTAWQVSISDFDPNLPREAIDTVTLTLNDLPPGVSVSGVPSGTVTYDAAAGGGFEFNGTGTEYAALQLIFPADFSTESPLLTGGVISGTLSATSTEDPVGQSAPVSLRITPEGDVTIDGSLPDLIPDETDAITPVFPSTLLAPALTDADGSESFTSIVLVVEGLPVDTIFFTNPDVSLTQELAPDGTYTATFTVDPSAADMVAAYNSIKFILREDFSTANRSDLSTGGTNLPLTFRLSVTTDEDQDLSDDTPVDGQQTIERIVDIGFEEDIDLSAPAQITADEDDGVANSTQGVTVDLEIDITIDDHDNSEVEDPTSPFGANVRILFSGLPAGTVATEGTLLGPFWFGSVAEARDLSLDLPGDYNGTINALITVSTREGTDVTPQTITINATPDVDVDGQVDTQETDAPLPVRLSDYVSILDPAPGETIIAGTLVVTGLPDGTMTNGGTLAADGSGTFTLTYDYPTDVTLPADLTITFPTDFSTVNPATTVSGALSLTINDGATTYTETATIPFNIAVEGDISVNDNAITLTETDAVVTFRPVDSITPQATDADGSESITQIAIAILQPPAGLRYTLDGTTYTDFPASGWFSISQAEYQSLVFEVPQDYSTESPATTLKIYVVATTDENGSNVGTLTVTVDAEGDIVLNGPGTLTLTENDTPGDQDEDSTTTAPVIFTVSDAIDAVATDADGSEAVASIDVTVNGLPDGAVYSTDGFQTITVVTGGTFSLTAMSPRNYDALQVRLPDDYSTTSDITGTVTARTDESLLAGETDSWPNDGVETREFTVTVASEADVRIDVQNITVIEDLGTTIPLNIAASVTDIDGSEAITAITVTFDGLPTNGPTTLTDGTPLTGPTGSWTGTAADLAALGVTSFPEHFSGVIDITVTVVTDEGVSTGTSDAFVLNVTPVAEPTIVLTVDDTETAVNTPAAGNYVVKEDNGFLLQIAAETPDQDGSESLTTITIDNLPVGWVASTGGVVDLSLFETSAADIASATVVGTTLTITLQPGITSFDGALRVTPLPDDDRDVATLTGNDLVATVTSVDTAAGLADDTATATDGVDVDVDAVVDDATQTVADVSVDENISGVLDLNLDLNGLGLTDNDGSEVFDAVELTFTIATASDAFDPATDMVLSGDPALAGSINSSVIGSTAKSVTYRFEPADGASTQQFSDALASIQLEFPQHFSGVVTIDGTADWHETTTPATYPGDVEQDASDNTNSDNFSFIKTVNPVAEAQLTASVFVLVDEDAAADSPTRVDATVKDGAVSGADILTLLESTSDGSSPGGQVDLYLGIQGATPDTDGSEELRTITVENVPTDWIAQYVTGGTIDQAAFFTADGTGPLTASEYAKIDSATYDDTTGLLTLTLVSDVTSFGASILLQPTLYEDYDIDRLDGDPYTAAGDFFGQDLNITIGVSDANTATTDDQQANAVLDVDVDPVNNFAVIDSLPLGNEQVIDDAGGVWAVSLDVSIPDGDGSEQITAIVLRSVPNAVTIFVSNPADPTGPKIPALITELDSPPGFNTWSLESNEWLDMEFRGIPTHWAGPISQNVQIVTTEDDGTTRVTTLDTPFYIDPVVDGGDPSETASTREDTAVQVVIDGNIIDNTTNSPLSPEAILNYLVIYNVGDDSAGRQPRFFDGDPADGGTEIFLSGGRLLLTPNQAANLWVLPGQDTNETMTFDVQVQYYETIDPTQTRVETGTITVNVQGVADTPDQVVQNEDPSTTAGGITQAEVDGTYRPDEVQDGAANYTRLYGYAGYDQIPFALNMRLTDDALENGFDTAPTVFEDATPLSASMTEIIVAPPDGYDGSETIYHIITGVDPSTSFIGGQSIDASGETYLVTDSNLANLMFVPSGVTEVTYYNMTLHTIVLEDDQIVDLPPGNSTLLNLAYINTLPGGSVVSEDFSVVVLPETDVGPPTPCPPEMQLPLPELTLLGSGDEDTQISLKLQITAVPGYYDSIGDLANLPNGVQGNFTLLIDLPEGASLSSDPSGAVLLDPTSGNYVVDIAKLGVDPNDPTQTEGSILYTPPPQQSSPVNPFDPSETLGPDDPYDDLTELTYQMRLINASCETVDTGGGSFSIFINPVVDGPGIVLAGATSFDEDTPYDLGLSIEAIDGGERLVGDVEITIGGDNGAQFYTSGGTLLTGTVNADGSTTYAVAPADLTGLYVVPTQHLSGNMTIKVSATSEDVDGSTLTNTVSNTVEVIPVADVPFIDFDDTVIDPDTGAPYVDTSGSAPVITMVEDQAFTLADVMEVDTPDQDGSETISITIFDIPSYMEVSGPSGSGFIDNGDGSYTISRTAFQQVTLKLSTENARTPDALDPTLPDSIPLRITVTTLETGNSDTQSTTQDFSVKVRPDADVADLTAFITPTTGTEDQPQAYTLSLEATVYDPHETADFRIDVPPNGTIYLDGVALIPDASGAVTVPGTPGPSTGLTTSFLADGTVTFVPDADFAGQVSLNVVAVTSDAALDSAFVDTQESAIETLDLDIAVAPDLILTVDTPLVDLQETDDVVTHDPAGDFTIEVTDVDGSETVDTVTYTISGVPDGTAYSVGSGTPIAVSGDLVFTGSLAEFDTLTVIFPRDFATDGTPLSGTINVTTNEGGNQSGSFSIEIDGELDLTVTNTTPIDLAQDGAPLTVDFGIVATVTDQQADPSEWLEDVVITFDTPLPNGTIASNGTFDASRQTLTFTRGGMDIATFTAAVAALSVTLPDSFSGGFNGTITVSTNHGTAPGQAYVVDVNDQPQISGPVTYASTETTFEIDFATLLANASDSDTLTVENPASADPDVSVLLLANSVQVTVPQGFIGTPVLTYDVVDDASIPASAQATADLEINTMQMVDTGLIVNGNPLLSDVTGGAGTTDIAFATDAADSVVFDAADRPYAGVEGFALMGGDDFVDLSGSSAGYAVDGGAGNDEIIGSAGNDVLTGGDGTDTLTGGAGDDVFAMTDLLAVDVITDYQTPGEPANTDEIDLTALVQLAAGEDVTDHVTYDNTTGTLSVDNTQVAIVNTDTGFADQVQVIFEDAANTQQSAVI